MTAPPAQAPPPPSDGIAWMDGEFLPLAEAKVGVTDWGLVRSDATYDVVSLWDGAFFRLEDHLDRFEASMHKLRLSVPQSRDDIRGILIDCVRRSGLRRSYVAMVCLRGVPIRPSRMPGACENKFIAYARPWVWVFPEDVIARGAHLVVPQSVRIPPESVDPRVKNYHWGDMTYGLFEAEDAGADSALLADADGFVCEGPGFNVFAFKDGTAITPNRGALEGITRKTVLEICAEMEIPVEIRPVTVEEFKDADEALACTTAGGIMPIRRLDDRIYANDAPGPLSLNINQRFWDWHARPELSLPVNYDA